MPLWMREALSERFAFTRRGSLKQNRFQLREKRDHMSVYDEKMWKKLVEKTAAEDVGKPVNLQCGDRYLSAIRGICDDAIAQAVTIRDMFPLYTLHDQTHICNVIRLMENLLGDQLEKLSRDEMAMLILAACCHDIGMSCGKTQLQELLEDSARLENYLEDHPDAYIRTRGIKNLTELPDDLLRDFLRAVHAERISDILLLMEWPEILQGKVDRQDLIEVCRSHGENTHKISDLYTQYGVNLCLCAILLRLADILDFDTSRAPQAIYRYSGFENRMDAASRFSHEEWQKHRASHGFRFDQVTNRSFPYGLPYQANCPSMQIEQAVNSYIDWIDQELTACQEMLRFCGENWRKFVLPQKIIRKIRSDGYLSGQFCLTLDQDRVLELLVGRNLYQDPSVFVRELLQNAIDAVRTRQQLDKNIPRHWRPQINIRCWMDEEGYHWFRIEDNGIGMNEDIIKKYFLKVGCSYYTSSDFQKEKYLCNGNEDYNPISRFGIGILSCFMGDKHTNQVEISTRHFSRDSDALRMSMNGTSGYYYIANKKVCPNPPQMKGISLEERRPYRTEAGTTIAVRTNLYQSGKYYSFREILDRYVVYPIVPVHYEDENSCFDYPTEQQLMDDIHKVNPSKNPDQRGVLEFFPTDEQIRDLELKIPGLEFPQKPKVVLKCIALDQYTESPNLSGVMLFADLTEGSGTYRVKLGETLIDVELYINLERIKHQLMLEFILTYPFKNHQQFGLNKHEWTIIKLVADELLRKEKIPLRKDILSAISNGEITDEGWCNYIQEENHVSEIAFFKEVNSVWADIAREYPHIKDTSLYQYYQQISSNRYMIRLCDLSTYPWYKQYFIRDGEESYNFIRGEEEESHIRLVAHNGVFCGDTDFFVKYSRFKVSEIILLLKDRYRPEVDVARTKIQDLPLETLVELEILRHEWPISQFISMSDHYSVGNQWIIPYKSYLKLMEKRPDLGSRLIFNTRQGTFTSEELPDKLNKYGYLNLIYLPEPKYGVDTYSCPDLYRYFSIAYLRKNYTLVGVLENNFSRILLMPKSTSDKGSDLTDFPPGFFLPVKGNYTFLTLTSYFLFCNENHPLSKFLIKNHVELNMMLPGLYQNLMYSLVWDERDKKIPNINKCLKQIQQLSHKKIIVPEDAFLTEKNFSIISEQN